MYGYDSEDFWGIIIAVLIGAFVIFLICRQLVCWYWKINKIVALLEDQNNLFKQLIKKGFGETDGGNKILYSAYSATHKVKLLMNSGGMGLRKEPSSQSAIFLMLSDDTEVQALEIGDEVVLKDKKAPWYKIRTKDDIIGWCFSGSLVRLQNENLL
ncbi:hypothetical protein FACS189461_3260 [Spirochaetia bacterium]|nr:hypothetical protein FACS189461_3260 [Spirochaetia bacterium]